MWHTKIKRKRKTTKNATLDRFIVIAGASSSQLSTCSASDCYACWQRGNLLLATLTYSQLVDCNDTARTYIGIKCSYVCMYVLWQHTPPPHATPQQQFSHSATLQCLRLAFTHSLFWYSSSFWLLLCACCTHTHTHIQAVAYIHTANDEIEHLANIWQRRANYCVVMPYHSL